MVSPWFNMTDFLMEKIHVKRQRHIQREDEVKTYKNIIHKPRDASGYWELGEGPRTDFLSQLSKEPTL